MRYKNMKTGAVVDSSFVISGDDWVLENTVIEEKTVIMNAEGTTTNVETNTAIEAENTENLVNHEENTQEEQNSTDQEEITKAQIMQELDAFGVEYNPRDKKQVLYDLMMQHGK